MKGSLLVLLLTLVGSLKATVPYPGFASGKVYQYEYNSTIVNTVPGQNLGMSAMRLTANVEIQSLGANKENLFKIHNPKLDNYVGFRSRIKFSNSPKQTAAVMICAHYDYKFTYLDGRVEKIYAPHDVSDFCMNLVRGILNMMYTTIKEDSYELQEIGIVGVCHTRYSIQEDRKNKVAIITRAKDLNNCKNKVVKNTGMSYIYFLPNYPQKDNMIKGTASFVTKMQYKNNQMSLIKEVNSEQIYEISPFNEPDGVGVMTARQELILTEVNAVKNVPEQRPKDYWPNYGNITYVFPKVLPPQMLIKATNFNEQAKRILEEVEQSSRQGIQASDAEKYLLLAQLCRRLNFNDLNRLFDTFKEKPRARHALLIGIAYAGTTESLKFTRECVEKKRPDTYEKVWFVPMCIHFASPNETTVNEIKAILRNIQDPWEVTTMFSYLAYGSLVYRHCAQYQSCSPSFLQPLHELLTTNKDSDEDKVILALKAISNAGQPPSLKPVMKFLSDRPENSRPDYIQLEAVRAIMKIGKQDPIKAQVILMNIFADDTRPLSVRMMACVGLLETKPTLTMPTTIANIVLMQKNMQLGSFVYSYMKSLVNTDLPHLYSVSSACNIAIKLLSTTFGDLSYRYSKAIYFHLFNCRYRYGVLGKFFMLNSPKTVFPTDIISNWEVFFGRAGLQLTEVALHTQNLNKLLRKNPFDQDPTQQRTQRQQNEWSSPEALLMMGSLKLLGQEIAFLKTDEKVIQEILNRKEPLKDFIDFLGEQVQGEKTHAMITEIGFRAPCIVGLPFQASGSGVALAQLKVNTEITLSHENARQKRIDNVQVHVDGNLVLQGNGTLHFGINTHDMQHLVEIKGSLRAVASPRFTVTVNMANQHLKIETTPLHEQVELLLVSHEAHVVSRDADDEKAAPVLPPRAATRIEDGYFYPDGTTSGRNDRTQRSKEHRDRAKEECYYNAESRTSDCEPFAIPIPIFYAEVCKQTIRKTKDAVSLWNPWMHALCREHKFRILLRPVRKGVPVDKIEARVQMRFQQRTKRNVEDDDNDDHDFETDLNMENLRRIVFTGDKKGYQSSQSSSGGSSSGRSSSDSSKRSSSSSSGSIKSSSSSSDSSSSSSSDSRKRGSSSDSRKSSSSSDSRKSSSSSSSSDSRKSSSSSDSRKSSSSSDSRKSSSDSRKSSSDSSKSSSSSDSSDSSSSNTRSSSESKAAGHHGARARRSSQKRLRGHSSSSSSGSSSSGSGSSSGGSRSRSSSSGSRSSSSGSRSSSSSSSESAEIYKKKESLEKIYNNEFRSWHEQQDKPTDKTGFQTKNGRAFLVASLYGLQNNKKVEGYDAAVYAVSKVELQILVAKTIGTERPVTCLHAAFSEHRVMATLKAGRDCQEYEVRAVYENGTFAHYPAVRLMVDFLKVPPCLKYIGKELLTLVPGIAAMMGYTQKEERNPPQQLELIAGLTNPWNYFLVMRMPTEVIYVTDGRLPVPLTLKPSIDILRPISFLSLDGVCSVNGETITTFNKKEIQNVLPKNCFQILVKDCEKDSKFLVMMKEQSENPEYKEVMVMFGSMTIHLRRNEKLNATDNYGEIKSFPHTVRMETGADSSIEIDLKKNKELELLAHEYGLEKLTYDGVKIKVEVNDEMRGALCGLCGKFDDEILKEYRTPTGYVAKNEQSFALSWVTHVERDLAAQTLYLEGKNKTWNSLGLEVQKACKLKQESVEYTGKGELSRCLPNMPVLRCIDGCMPSETREFTVGFHCVPSNSTVSLTRRHTEKYEDMEKLTEFHTACSCTQ